jgi:hypothetical protein
VQDVVRPLDGVDPLRPALTAKDGHLRSPHPHSMTGVRL